jgi:uncharacterized metal-binding protein YceD (DUF177 family)
VTTPSEALLNLSSLLTNAPGAPLEVEADGLFMPLPEELEAIGLTLAGPLTWTVTVRSTGGDDDFIAEGRVAGTSIMECRRCLTDVETPVAAEFIYPMHYQPGQEANLSLIEAPLPSEVDDLEGLDESGEDRLSFAAPEVDFAPLLLQLFAIEQPLTVLCKADCRGLSTDGVNLNEHPGHQVEVEDEEPAEASPFEALRDLDLGQE